MGLAVATGVGGASGMPLVDAEEVEVEKMARWTVCFSNSVPRFSCDEMFFMKLNRWLLLDGVPLDCGDRTLEGKRKGLKKNEVQKYANNYLSLDLETVLELLMVNRDTLRRL